MGIMELVMRVGFLWSGIDNKKERREGVVRKRLMSLGRLLSNFSKESQRARVGIYKRERWGYRVKFEMELPGKKIFAEGKGKDLIKTVVEVREKVKRQIKGHVERLRGN